MRRIACIMLVIFACYKGRLTVLGIPSSWPLFDSFHFEKFENEKYIVLKSPTFHKRAYQKQRLILPKTKI